MGNIAPDGGLGRAWPVSVDEMRWHYPAESANRAEVIRAPGGGCQGTHCPAETRVCHTGNMANEALISTAPGALMGNGRD